jgi:hypothetical protein
MQLLPVPLTELRKMHNAFTSATPDEDAFSKLVGKAFPEYVRKFMSDLEVVKGPPKWEKAPSTAPVFVTSMDDLKLSF